MYYVSNQNYTLTAKITTRQVQFNYLLNTRLFVSIYLHQTFFPFLGPLDPTYYLHIIHTAQGSWRAVLNRFLISPTLLRLSAFPWDTGLALIRQMDESNWVENSFCLFGSYRHLLLHYFESYMFYINNDFRICKIFSWIKFFTFLFRLFFWFMTGLLSNLDTTQGLPQTFQPIWSSRSDEEREHTYILTDTQDKPSIFMYMAISVISRCANFRGNLFFMYSPSTVSTVILINCICVPDGNPRWGHGGGQIRDLQSTAHQPSEEEKIIRWSAS